MTSFSNTAHCQTATDRTSLGCLSCCLLCTRVQINDLAYEAVVDPATGAVRFNVLVGGYFSLKRNIMSVPLGVSLSEEQLIPFTLATLRAFR